MHPNPRILLIEDDPGVRQALERVLCGSGYLVFSFGSAEALQLEPDAGSLVLGCHCLVCDVRLPGLSGFELHRRLEERGSLPPWIYITGQDEPSIGKQAERDGAACLAKPFAGKALLALIEQMARFRNPEPVLLPQGAAGLPP